MTVTPTTGPVRLRVEVAIGGAVGTLLRVGAVTVAVAWGPGRGVLGVLGVNLLGAFLLGRLTRRAATDGRVARWLPPVGGGLLGGLTTFSALASELALRIADGEVGVAVTLAVVSVLGGVLAAAAGLGTTRPRPRGGRSAAGQPS